MESLVGKDQNKDIDQVYERVYQSGYHVPTHNPELMRELGITHILAIIGTPPEFPDQFKYLWFGELKDDNTQELGDKLREGLKFVTDALNEN
jgi:protein-tyrosine phosphatase